MVLWVKTAGSFGCTVTWLKFNLSYWFHMSNGLSSRTTVTVSSVECKYIPTHKLVKLLLLTLV